MSQLDVLRAIQKRLGGDEFVKLEIGNHENYEPVVKGSAESRIVIICKGRFFPAIVTDDEWEYPGLLVETLCSWVESHT